jgi:hypothetical protein
MATQKAKVSKKFFFEKKVAPPGEPKNFWPPRAGALSPWTPLIATSGGD